MQPFNLWITLLVIVIVVGAIQGLVSYLILVERKVCAFMQERIGPNRVGPFGLLQPIADGLKFVLKEDIIPRHVDKVLYLLAPMVAVGMALMAFVVVPFGSTPVPGSSSENEFSYVIAPNIDIGIVFVFAIGSLNVYGVILGGWASNNKYSFLGSLRASAQIVSYEIPMGTSILGIALMTGSLNLEKIIAHQSTSIASWNLWVQPLAFLLFLISVFAECNRLPFDLPEAEQELVGGYHTEYSALKFGLFFLAEYTHMITTSFLMVALFCGGWHFPLIADPGTVGVGAAAAKIVVFFAKMMCFILFYMVIRWTIPRFRFDQLMALAWKVMIPLAFLNLVAVMVVKEVGASPWWLLPASFVMLVGAGIIASNWPRGPARVIVVTRGHERVETVVM